MTRNDYTRRTFVRTTTALTGLAGFSSLAAADHDESVVVVDGTESDDIQWYNLAVTGELTGKSTAEGASRNDSDWLESTAVAGGYVRGGKDAYTFTGELVGLWSDGDPDVSVDGSRIDPDPLRMVSIQKDDAASRVDYELSVSGLLSSSAANGASIDGGDRVAGGRARGDVKGGTDSYAFSGDVEDLNADGGLTVVVDGETVGYEGEWPPQSSDDGSDGSSGDGSETGGSDDPDSFAAQVERRVHEKVNARRRANGLSDLGYDADLAAAARAHSQDMIDRDFFSHVAPGDSSFADHYEDEGVSCSGLGENILYRSLRSEDVDAVAENVVTQWMNSAGHRENILDDGWLVEGIGAVVSDGRIYVTQGFGSGC
ncbi:Cysteine-rich secretory protein family protein [Halogranum amylolyticum]|uniref:Cysteine-rich secretory protein family protein n=1 Tax=Halogranum amylolyticum TaxID=660520 RepID=A0A1H8NHP6_9EURY|nr:CAP domain-containing protein [Halogranum amylolyticum]SEO29107.1 Cysteine-rich secretory protein family protein [Halogranum amylolyticum]